MTFRNNAKKTLKLNLDDIFCENGYINELDKYNYQHNRTVTKIELVRTKNTAITIGDNFLCGCVKLSVIDMSALSHIIRIGDNFLCGCVKLSTIDLTPFSEVVQIGCDFLSLCNNLSGVDLTPLSKVIKFGDYCMYGCISVDLLHFEPIVVPAIVQKEAIVDAKKTEYIEKLEKKFDDAFLENMYKAFRNAEAGTSFDAYIIEKCEEKTYNTGQFSDDDIKFLKTRGCNYLRKGLENDIFRAYVFDTIVEFCDRGMRGGGSWKEIKQNAYEMDLSAIYRLCRKKFKQTNNPARIKLSMLMCEARRST
jgi:hypothetical protein